MYDLVDIISTWEIDYNDAICKEQSLCTSAVDSEINVQTGVAFNKGQTYTLVGSYNDQLVTSMIHGICQITMLWNYYFLYQYSSYSVATAFYNFITLIYSSIPDGIEILLPVIIKQQ